MKRLGDLIGRTLEWRQPAAGRRDFELVDGEEVVATLKFRSTWGSHAEFESADGAWTFKRVGFWRTHATVRARNGQTNLATFTNATWSGGGTLAMADGRRLHANTNMWGSKYAFRSEDEVALVHFERIRGAFHLAAQMTIEPAAAAWPELAWLGGFGWYLAIKMHDDAAGGAAAAAAGA